MKSPRQTPENEALRLECAALAETFAELLAERETLAHVVRPDLEAEYRLKLERAPGGSARRGVRGATGTRPWRD